MSDEWTFDLCGGHLALDFANTVSDRESDHPIERLSSFNRLVAFFLQEQVLSAKEAKRLEAWAEARPEEAGAIVAEARALREALHVIFTAVAAGAEPPEPALEELNRWLKQLRLGPHLEWEWAGRGQVLAGPYAALMRLVLSLLTSADRAHVRTCAAETCAWLFFDTSKNHSRRWCDMKVCGNRMKARRFQERAR